MDPPLRIAMLAPPWYALPPHGYGGLEEVCAALIDALVARGNRVTLFGAGTGTATAAEFVPTDPKLQNTRLNEGMPEMVHVARANPLIEAGGFDVVHDHTMAGLLTAPNRTVPTVATVHGRPIGELADYLRLVDRSVALVSISYAQRRLGAGLPWTSTIHHGLARTGPVKPALGSGPALWLARFHPDKGPDLAIRACARAGLPLVLAGKCTEPVERRYFKEVIAPMVGPGAEVVLNADRRRTRELLWNARCLLLPVRWDEPFGMVLIEAMATGTPVVALNRGAVPEIVRHGETGFICNSPDELPAALHEIGRIDPAACVRHVRTHFSVDTMARRYEYLYRQCAVKSAAEQVELAQVA